MFLAHSDFAEFVFVLVLEMQGCDVIQDHRGGPGGSGRVGQARLGQGAAVVAGLTAFQRGSQSVPVRGCNAEVLENSDRGGFRSWLHKPGEHHRSEGLVPEDVEAQPGVGFCEDLPEDLAP